MMNKSLRGGGAESSRKTYYGFQLLVLVIPVRPRFCACGCFPGRSAARSGALQSRGRNDCQCLVTVPVLRSGMKNAASRPGHR
jgi:hypothetical protein